MKKLSTFPTQCFCVFRLSEYAAIISLYSMNRWIFKRVPIINEKCLLASSCLSVCPHVPARLPLDGCMKFDIGDLHENLSRNSKFGQNEPKISCTLHGDTSVFHTVGSDIYTSTIERKRIVAFPWQQRIRQRTTVFRVTYIAYLVITETRVILHFICI